MNKLFLNKLVSKGYLLLEYNPVEVRKCKEEELACLLQSINSLGYTIDEDGIKKLSNLSSISLGHFYFEIFNLLKEISGVNYNHRIFYRNFPDLSGISVNEFYVRAIIHYITSSDEELGFMNDDILDFERVNIHNESKTVLKIIDKYEADDIICEIAVSTIQAKKPIPNSEDEFLLEVLKEYKYLDVWNIPFKENIAKYISFIVEKNEHKQLSKILNKSVLRFVSTPTDLLRVYAVLSKGDITLRKNVKFISLPRLIRRLFLNILNDICENNIYFIDDLARHEFLWKKAFEKLHVGEYKDKYNSLAEAVNQFRNNDYTTYNGLVEKNINNQDELLNILSECPGVFARKLDEVLRKKSFDPVKTLNAFKEVSGLISSNVLLQLWEFFKNRNLYPTRIFKINGQYSSFYKEIEENREIISLEIIDKVIAMIEEALSYKFHGKDFIRNVYIDESVKNYCLPINNRNASSQNKTLTFGTRIKLEGEGDFLRFFTHFKNMPNKGGRVDVDLSMEFFDDQFNEVCSLSWHSMSGGKKFESYHSGDIVNAPDGASEFIDLNYIKAKKYARYAVVTNCVYTYQSFADIPECFSGVMFMPEKCKKGDVFNPEFLRYKFDLCQKNSNNNVAFAVDLKNLELIWIDSSFCYNDCCFVASESYGVVLALKNALKEHMNLYDFFMLHNKHLSLVDKKEDADFIISDSEDADLKPFDVEKITENWL